MTPIHPGWLAALLLGGMVAVLLIVLAGTWRAWARDDDAKGEGEGD